MFDLKVPRLNPNDETVVIGRWLVEDGASVKAGDSIAELVSSKIVFVLEAENDGYLEILKEASERASVGEVIATVGPLQNSGRRTASSQNQTAAPSTAFSKAARTKLKELGGKESDFQNEALVTAEMVEKKYSPAGAGANPTHNVEKSEDISVAKRFEIQALSEGQKAIVSRVCCELPTKELLDKSDALGFPYKSVTPIILFETYHLIKSNFPKLNASFSNNQVHYFSNLALGFALDTGSGLKVADLKIEKATTPAAVAERIVELTLSDLRKQPKPEDFGATTFTITDLSSFQIVDFDPVINGAQAAILGIGGDSENAVPFVRLILTFDHRILTGREASEFLVQLKKRVLSYAK